ncbi:hypothetical protein O0L34_g4984 [Tuta absoluta]|nr:hypothetical protein O0L34_g4984 [Tuta absoluta]
MATYRIYSLLGGLFLGLLLLFPALGRLLAMLADDGWWATYRIYSLLGGLMMAGGLPTGSTHFLVDCSLACFSCSLRLAASSRCWRMMAGGLPTGSSHFLVD